MRKEGFALIHYTYNGILRSARVMIVITSQETSYWLSFPKATGRFFKRNNEWIWEGPVKPEELKRLLIAAIEYYIIDGNELTTILIR
jgi:hypothetical protein